MRRWDGADWLGLFVLLSLAAVAAMRWDCLPFLLPGSPAEPLDLFVECQGRAQILQGFWPIFALVGAVLIWLFRERIVGFLRALWALVCRVSPWERKRKPYTRSLGYRTHRNVLWTAVERNGRVDVDGPWCPRDHAALDHRTGGGVAIPAMDAMSLWGAAHLVCPTCQRTYAPVQTQGSQITIGGMRDEVRRLYEATAMPNKNEG